MHRTKIISRTFRHIRTFAKQKSTLSFFVITNINFHEDSRRNIFVITNINVQEDTQRNIFVATNLHHPLIPFLCWVAFYFISFLTNFTVFCVFIFIQIFNDIQTVTVHCRYCTGFEEHKKEVLVLNVEEKNFFLS